MQASKSIYLRRNTNGESSTQELEAIIGQYKQNCPTLKLARLESKFIKVVAHTERTGGSPKELQK
jgi:hypothetical protein